MTEPDYLIRTRVCSTAADMPSCALERPKHNVPCLDAPLSSSMPSSKRLFLTEFVFCSSTAQRVGPTPSTREALKST